MQDDLQGWTLVDAFCGLGGFSAGALHALQTRGISNIRVVGIDFAAEPLALFKTNVARVVGEENVVTVCKEIGKDAIEWPDESGRLIVHFSPSCTPFSKARRNSNPATPSQLSHGLEIIEMILDLILSKNYVRWTIEEVSHPSIVKLVSEFASKHPEKIAYDTFDAVSFGCPSERRRLIVAPPYVIRSVKSKTSIKFLTPRDALHTFGLTPPSEFFRNGNLSCEPRSINRPAFTVTASHGLVWCTNDRILVRCMTPTESAALVGLPPTWKLPNAVGAAQRAVGNVVSSALSHALVMSELEFIPYETSSELVASSPADHATMNTLVTPTIEQLIKTIVEREIGRMRDEILQSRKRGREDDHAELVAHASAPSTSVL